MGYYVVDPEALEPLEDRPCAARAVIGNKGAVTGFDHLGLRFYDPAPGEQIPLRYHYHEQQEEAFYVISGELHVETPGEEYVIGEGEVFVVEAGSPQRAFNPAEAPGPIRVLAVGAPTTDGGIQYEPED